MADSSIAMLYGQTINAAPAIIFDESPPASVPDRILYQGILIGRFVFQSGAASATRTETAFGTSFTSAQVEDHGELAGLSDNDHPQYFLAASTAVFATSGSYYVAWSADPLLNNEKVITAGSSVILITDSTAVYVTANTAWAYSTLSIGSGGTNSSTALNNSRIMVSTGGSIVESAAITDGESIQRNNTSFISAPIPFVCEGRLTVNSGGVPVPSITVTTQGTLFFTPYKGNRIALYDSTRWRMYTFSELSAPLVITSTSNYDVFLYDSGGTLRLELSSVWTNDTTRANALVLQDGVYVKSGSTSRLYLGTIRASSTNVTEFSFGATNTQGNLYVWNAYNRVLFRSFVTNSTDSWTYGSSTWRAANGDSQMRHAFVRGLNEDNMYALYGATCDADNGEAGAWGVALDATNTNHGSLTSIYQTGATLVRNSGPATWVGAPGIGYHFLQAVESAAIGTVTYYGDGGGSIGAGDRYFVFQSIGMF